jgi:hypothetical protein
MLQFPDLVQLARFRTILNGVPFEMNMQSLTITCHCNDELLKEATLFYRARVVAQGQQNGRLNDGELKEA